MPSLIAALGPAAVSGTLGDSRVPTAMTNVAWKVLETFSDEISALTLKQRLEIEGVPAVVRSDTALLGVARRCTVLVPSELHHRAQWLQGAGTVSDEELLFLATGELSKVSPAKTE